jgi:benzoate-CoA ligase
VCARGLGAHVLGTRPDDRLFSASKLFFAYGLGNGLYYPADAGASAVLYQGRATPAALIDQIARHRPTIFFAVPTVYAQLCAALEAGAGADLASLRLCLSAGETLPPVLFERWRARTGLEILDGLGSTEACQTFVSNRPGACRPGSCGLPVPGYEVRVDAPPGEIGDLLVRGDSIMAGYWDRDDATRKVLDGEWLRTGDKVHLDDDGFVWHAGRVDDLLKVSGQWVSPIEVERVLSDHPAVLECGVVGRKDADGLVRPHAVVVARRGATLRAEELLRFAAMRLPHHKIPRSVSLVEALPRTATGKLRRFLLRDL